MNWSNIWSKVKHAVIPAAGAGLAVAIPVAGAGAGVAVIVKAAIGGFIAYMLKSARPAPPAK